MQDEELDDCLVRARRGDAEAYGRVVEALHWPMRLWLAARCPPEIDPDEVAHLAFVHGFTIIDGYQPGSSPRAWLWTVARHQLLAQITALRRRQDQQRRYVPEAVRQALERMADDPVDADERAIEALRACLSEMPIAARAVLDGHYRDGLALAELAARLGRSAGGVKKQICLLRQALRACVERRTAHA